MTSQQLRPTSQRALLAPTIVTGVLFAGYLALRPYGDIAEGSARAEAFASSAWLLAHVAGALALAAFGWLTVRLHDLLGTRLSAVARATGVSGTVLVLPYYGAETFGLHAVGARALAGDPGVLELVDTVRYQPLAMTLFGLGLLLLAAAGVTTALAWQRGARTRRHRAAWPLGLAMALVLPQFVLPPAGRVAFGIATLVAALVLASALVDDPGRPAEDAATGDPAAAGIEQAWRGVTKDRPGR